MRPVDERDRRPDGQGGVPDGLLVGLLAFLLGMTVMVWTATGLAGLFAHGAWPTGVTFARTPLAMRHLVARPHDVPGAWPEADAAGLSGYGLFWGLLIGQLMILIVLTVFVLGTLARWRAVRARRRAEPATPPDATPHDIPSPRPTEPWPAHQPQVIHDPAPTHTPPPPPATPAYAEALPHSTVPPPAQPVTEPLASPADTTRVGGWEATPTAGTVRFGPPATRHPTAIQAVRDAEGPALIVTSNPAIWQDTKDARAKLGPVHVYDPTHLCDTPSRLHWSPTSGCESKPTAAARATALLAPIRPTAKMDQALTDVAETLLRSYLHAAAIDGRTIRHVHRWCQGTQVQDAVRTLRTHPKAAPGSAGELEAALTAHPERRDIAQELTGRALSALSTVNVREACTPHRTDALALDSFVDEGGTLYVVGESIEDPRTNPGAMPLLTALTSSVVERGRHMAERSSSGRLDPPLTLVLDDVAAVAPLPQLPELLAAGADRGLPTLALLRSREQARSRWPNAELPV
ncbi:type IV secretory system conjugative DNA transfer family protein [Streptomyces sp. ALI-76-A]|uniref:type IV secretory system conjugative DNA transfer family protein n=1 Tax=Streptomyces sp. ALI-76-A TaxID=3025736 RepID=UPI00256EE723|nr:type IV secretory system conjugative DNA transfer family protein [Streptomyces sp. ALI-76-A]MDL5202443.1 type IV secretory system conjugative DNA transfer family protein [Streptomyces sp. ALI-76-A]